MQSCQYFRGTTLAMYTSLFCLRGSCEGTFPFPGTFSGRNAGQFFSEIFLLELFHSHINVNNVYIYSAMYIYMPKLI